MEMEKKSRPPIEELIGKKLWRLRKERGFSQEVLADMSDINASFLGCIERGQKCPTLRVLEKIRRALDVPYAELFDFAPRKRSDHEQKVREKVVQLARELDDEDLGFLDDILQAFLARTSSSEEASNKVSAQ